MMSLREKSILEERMFVSRLPDSPSGALILAPLIDVFFLLLIFISLGAGLVYSRGFMIEPPDAEDAGYEYADKLVIAMEPVVLAPGQRSVQLFFNDQPIQDYNTLENQLNPSLEQNSGKRDPNARLPVIILRADKGVPLNDVAQVMSICRRNNLRLFIPTREK